MSIKAIDLFSGCGGVSCGLTRAGFSVEAAVEIDKDAVSTYLSYPPLSKVHVILGDICKIKGTEILQAGQISSNELYLLAGCPPCQNFSVQNPNNKHKPETDRKRLLFEFLRIIKEIYPPFILMENVPGIKAEYNSKILKEFLSELTNEDGSDSKKYIFEYQIINAADYGVPQNRKRFVLHAVRKDVYSEMRSCSLDFSFPPPTHSIDGNNGLRHWVTVRDAIGDLPEITAGEEYIGSPLIHNHKCANLSETNLEKIRYIRSHGGSRDCLPDEMVLDCHKRLEAEGGKSIGHKDVYGIMDPEKPAPTMTGGCLFYTKGRYGHFSQDRAISIREAARIQTFPDDFIFSNNLQKAALQIGNAVPVKLVEASATELLRIINLLLLHRQKRVMTCTPFTVRNQRQDK